MKTKASILWALGCVVIWANASAADVADVARLKIGFAKPPVAPAAQEVPRQALYPEGADSREHGPFANVVGGRIAALTVTWGPPTIQNRTRDRESDKGLIDQHEHADLDLSRLVIW